MEPASIVPCLCGMILILMVLLLLFLELLSWLVVIRSVCSTARRSVLSYVRTSEHCALFLRAQSMFHLVRGDIM